MGVVYLARNRLLEREEVLKVVNQDLLARAGGKERFLREIQAAAKLNHPNVVTAYNALQLGEVMVFAMEYVEGEDLAQIVKARGGPLPVANACYYVQQAAQGLQHACDKQMVHRDIKPQNLILARVGKKHMVKILDFGLAKVVREKGEEPGLTGAGKMMGTPDYIAPEQAMDAARADIRADIYSLGCTFYYLLTGRPPFQGNSVYAILQAHHTETATAVNVVRPDVPPAVAEVVAKMMAKDPAGRYQKPAEVVQALTPLVKAASKGLTPVLMSSPVHGVAAEMLQHRNETIIPVTFKRETLIDQPGELIKTSRRPSVSGKSRKKLFLGLGAVIGMLCLAGLVGLWAAGVFRVRTNDGVLVVEVNEPYAEVFIDGDRVTVTWGPNGKKAEMRVKPGTHQVSVTKEGFSTHGEKVTLDDGGRQILTAKLEQTAAIATRQKKSLAVPATKDESLEPRDVDGKLRVPERARVLSAKKGLLERYKAELISGDIEAKARLAKTLMEHASAVPVNQTDRRYAMLAWAGELAVEAGNFDLAMETCTQLHQSFVVDLIRLKVDLLKEAMPFLGRRGPAAAEEMTQAALSAGFEAISLDQYDQARRITPMAKTAAAKSTLANLVYQADFLEEEVFRIEGRYLRVKPDLDKILVEPDNADANSAAGKFLCLVKNDWDQGLKMLMKSNNPDLKALADKELGKLTTAPDQVALGDLWWQKAQNLPPEENLDFRRRARYWYLKGLALLKVSERARQAARLQPRIDSVPVRPVTIRIQFIDTLGYHDLKLSNDGITHWSSHGGNGVRINHLRLTEPWAKPDSHEKHNSGAWRLYPDAIDFSTVDVSKEWKHELGHMEFKFAIDHFEMRVLNYTDKSAINFDITLTFHANGFILANRYSGLWDTKYYKYAQSNADFTPANWDQIVSGQPLIHEMRDRIDFYMCPTHHWDAKWALPSDKLPLEFFAIVANSEWRLPAGMYQIRTVADDGVRVYIDNNKVLDDWPGNWRKPHRSADLSLTAGVHRLQVEYFQVRGHSRLQFALRRLGDWTPARAPEPEHMAAPSPAKAAKSQVPPRLPDLIKQLRGNDLQLRRQAAAALRNLGREARVALSALRKALDDPDEELRMLVALAIGSVGEDAAPAVNDLVRHVADPKESARVRAECAVALNRIGPVFQAVAAVPTLLKVLGDPANNMKVRERVLWALSVHNWNLRNLNVFPTMTKILSEPNVPGTMLRYDCAYLLGLLQGSQAADKAIDVLLELLQVDGVSIYTGRDVAIDNGSAQDSASKANIKEKYSGDGRIVPIAALDQIANERSGRERIRSRITLMQKLNDLANSGTTPEELRQKAKGLLRKLAN